MKCPECGEEFVRHSGSARTMVGYFSPPGHNHNDNCESRTYWCKKDHRTRLSIRQRCPECDWMGKEECFCHPGKKIDKWPEIEQ
jgi:predicted RNA-binding Zn-ribbon protein involved in translation (DUF1610 family)